MLYFDILAKKFIEKMDPSFDYNVNIMNDKGIIVASRDASRIGDFHEVAYGLLTGKFQTGVIKEQGKYIGTKPGVNLFIDYKGKHIGVICVTGDPANVSAFAGLVKSSMEVMIEYELKSRRDKQLQSEGEKFINYLLFDENAETHQISSMAKELNININCLRTFIIIRYPSDYDAEVIIRALNESKRSKYLDIICQMNSNELLLLKSVGDKNDSSLRNYKSIIETYVEDFNKALDDSYDSSKITFYVGSIQSNIDKYKDSYIHSKFLSVIKPKNNQIIFFNDNVINYLRHIATVREYDAIFNIYEELFTKEEMVILLQTAEVMLENNYNIVKSAQKLFIHRNTLLSRLSKMNEILNIDPITNSRDREFLTEFAYYIKIKNNL
jgi:carbohydrate diacid regulator